MKKIISCFITAAVSAALTLSSFVSAFAEVQETPTMFAQACIENETLDVFVSGGFDLQNISAKVSNQTANVTNIGLISEGGIHVRTTVLVDISTSMPAETRTKVVEFIEEKIKNLDSYEELRLVTFGDEVKILMDFTSDRYDLSNAVKEIEFNGMASAVYDAINSTIVKPETINGSPCFYHTIIMTDGVDSTQTGITKEELLIRLRDEMYPIDVVGVSKNKPQTPDKELSALSRISNGTYTDLYSGADVSECISQVSSNSLAWIRAEVPASLLDGSTRQVDLSDGSNSVSFDMKMSVVDAPVEIPPESQPSVSSSSPFSQPVFTAPNSSKPSSDVSDEDEGLVLDPMMLIIIVAAVAVVGIAVAVIIIVVNKKKSKRSQQNQRSELYENSASNNSFRTQIINEPEAGEHYSIKLSNVADPSENWTIDVRADVIIGRAENCTICIDEMSVSREQCKIALSKDGLVISNISSTNKTKLNGVFLAAEEVLRPADIIHFGRITLRVDFIQKVTDGISPLNPPSDGSGMRMTQSLF